MSPDDRFIESIRQASFISARRADGIITAVSTVVKTMLGYNHDEFVSCAKRFRRWAARAVMQFDERHNHGSIHHTL